MKMIVNAACLALLLLYSCNRAGRPLYSSHLYTVYADRVVQEEFTAKALGPEHLVSDYKSLNTGIDPDIEFKFSINGRDNELAFGVNHTANIFPGTDDTVVLEMTFGQLSDLGSPEPLSGLLPPNTNVRFMVDLREVISSFREKGYYDDINGDRIYTDDFKGLYIAGDTYPLSWDFENITGNRQLTMDDHDGDGVYEKELVFNVYDPAAHTSAEWIMENDVRALPQFQSPYPLLDAIYNMTLDELAMLMEDDGTFRTGKEWPGVWTRDVSYATLLALAWFDTERCMTSLMKKTEGNRIIQDTGTGGAWPVSSDRVVWSLAAWEIYKYTGDREWLEKAFEIVKASAEADSMTIIDGLTGLIRGESSFLDWRRQTYPLWMEPADIYYSLNLGTNAAYCQSLKVLGMMARELGKEDQWSEQAEELREKINSHLWQEDKGYYGQYLYGRYYRSLSPRAEALGESFAVLFDIAGEERSERVLRNTPVTPYGITCIYPQIPGIPPYHNNGIWPLVEAFWTMANAREKELSGVESGLASIIRPAALFLTNKENFVAGSGDFAGTEVNSDRQLWSVAAMLAMYHRVIFGISFESDRMTFDPVIPRSFRGSYSLRDFSYRNAIFNISIRGWGDGVSAFLIDGKEVSDHSLSATLTGTHNIEILMNGRSASEKRSAVPNRTAPVTPVASAGDEMLSWGPVESAAEYQVYRNGELYATTMDTTMQVKGETEDGEYQVMAVDSGGVQSFLSNPVYPVPTDHVIIAEAEDYNVTREDRAAGFSGRGYVRLIAEERKELVIHLKAGAGTYALRMRYANGAGPVNTDNNCGIRSLYVNDIFSCSLVFPQRGMDEWSDWGMTNIEMVTLHEGDNTLSVRYNDFNRNMDGETNEFLLDYIVLQKIR